MVIFVVRKGCAVAGITSREYEETKAAFVSLLGLPVLLQSLAIFLNLFVGFVRDAWGNFPFLDTLGFFPSMAPCICSHLAHSQLGCPVGIVREWMSIVGGLLFPLMVLVGSFLANEDAPWENALLAW